MGKIEDRLAELGYELPAAGVPKGNYVNVVRTGDYIYTCAYPTSHTSRKNSNSDNASCHSCSMCQSIAGHLPVTTAGELITGKLGKDLTTEEGYAAAQRVALALLATLKSTRSDKRNLVVGDRRD